MSLILDPHNIPQSEFPFFISCASQGWVEALIRWRTNSWCNHSMLAINQGKFVWESVTSWYGEGDMSAYMTPGTTLKFYQLVHQTPDTINALRQYVQKRIAAGPLDHIYDWFGIAGEAIGFPKMHTPGLEYCSVDDIHALKTIAWTLPKEDQSFIKNLPDEQNPGYLDRFMTYTPTVMQLFGTYTYGAKI